MDSGRTRVISKRRFSIPSSAPFGPTCFRTVFTDAVRLDDWTKLDQTKMTIEDTKRKPDEMELFHLDVVVQCLLS